MENALVAMLPAHSGFDPRSLSARALEDEILTLSASISIATWRLLMLIAELDRRGAWQQWGVLSCAHWLNWKCGIDMGAAREKLRVARALEALPGVSAALARGEISYSKARAITRVATPASEAYLLDIARYGTAAHLERLVRAYRGVERYQEAQRARAVYETRALRWRWAEDGSIVITAQLPPEQAELVIKALQAAEAQLRAEREGVDREPLEPHDVSAETSRSLWCGEKMDLLDAVEFLVQYNTGVRGQSSR